ncbi:ROK family protein [Chloroflexia bacterium SDU3-3]|nr:ROK family protein [Chloroflexia bacterium SDU3-3]
MPLYGAIEAGGTKWVCAVGTGPDDIRDLVRFPTTTPEETLGQAVAFFSSMPDLAALGIGSFGPVDLHRSSPTYGYITTTPKPGWTNTEVAGVFARALGVPVAFDTDVNAAALGEHRWGAAQGLESCVYITVGTGIGGGVFVQGRLLHGLLHPEIGHMLLPRDPQRDPYTGACPYHGDCLEGLAAGPALLGRYGQRGETLPPDHPAWELEAHYLALACANLVLTLSPQRIILGGGVMHQPSMFPMLRAELLRVLGGYVRMPQIEQQIESYVVPPALGDRAGVLGALALAQQALA